MNKIVFSFTILFLLARFNSLAQQVSFTQAAADFKLVNEAYLSAKSLEMNVHYTLFSDYTSPVVAQQGEGVFMKQGSSSYSNLLGTISIQNSAVSVTVDSSEETIIVTDPLKKDGMDPSPVALDSLLQVCSSVEYKNFEGNKKFYKLRFDNRAFFEYRFIEVYIDGNTNFLDRLVLYYNAEIDSNPDDNVDQKNKPRLEISYTNISTSPVFPADQFSEKKFIQTSGKTISCAPDYSGFRLINDKLK